MGVQLKYTSVMFVVAVSLVLFYVGGLLSGVVMVTLRFLDLLFVGSIVRMETR